MSGPAIPTGRVTLDALPEKPEGWTMHLVMHLNFGRGKGSASYALHDAEGRQVAGVAYGYDTREGGGRGFFLTAPEAAALSEQIAAAKVAEAADRIAEPTEEQAAGFLTWAQLRAAYAAAQAGAP